MRQSIQKLILLVLAISCAFPWSAQADSLPYRDGEGPCKDSYDSTAVRQVVIATDGRQWDMKIEPLNDVLFWKMRDDGYMPRSIDGTPILLSIQKVKAIVPICKLGHDWKQYAWGTIVFRSRHPLTEDTVIHAGLAFGTRTSRERVVTIETVRWAKGTSSVEVRVMARSAGAKGELPAHADLVESSPMFNIGGLTNEHPIVVHAQ